MSIFARYSKIILFTFVFVVLLIVSPIKTLAYTGSDSVQTNVPENTHTSAQIIMLETINALFCQLTGIDAINPSQPCLDVDPQTQKIGYVKTPAELSSRPKVGGMLGLVTNMMAATYDLPIRSGDYTSYIASNFGLTKPAYGQVAQTGQGFENLKPVLRLWTRVRDLTYVLFVLLFVFVGIAIMLRLKIDARTAMSIQNQVPKIIITLLLVTFSYSIAGAMVDMMWVGTYLGINFLTDGESCNNVPLSKVATDKLLSNPIDYVNNIFESIKGDNCAFKDVVGINALGELSSEAGNVFGDLAGRVVVSALGLGDGQIGCGLGDPWACVRQVPFAIVSFIVSRLGALVIIIAILAQLIRVWFQLMKAYLYLFLYTLMGPLWIVIGIIPGVSSYGFRDWINHLLFAISVYPVTIFLFTVGIVIMNDDTIRNAASRGGQVFVPPLVGNPNIGNNLGFIFGLAVILMSPEVVNMMRSAFKSPPSKYVPTIFAGAAIGAGLATKPVTGTWGALNARKSTGEATGLLAHVSDIGKGKVIRGIGKKLGTDFGAEGQGGILGDLYRKSAMGSAAISYDKRREDAANAAKAAKTPPTAGATVDTTGAAGATGGGQAPADPNAPGSGGLGPEVIAQLGELGDAAQQAASNIANINQSPPGPVVPGTTNTAAANLTGVAQPGDQGQGQDKVADTGDSETA